ncbi:Glyoxalase/bleomycin resistance protein/dioxygenase-like protein [Podospora appendiculata]|uniref:Glyoxalase/bleomycin resistance protein/dioxygenase-like protein n=1 Tax=Podospora appendiculata TaxID=314037 RepID=A0AAE0XCJ1_9PEZI|nr:Glyoxalase/bleomycin resistance protein/dioxygenase-like protein [Podospora appendiculata]
MTIDHTGILIPADKYDAVLAWYKAALAPLGYKQTVSYNGGKVAGFSDTPGHVDWYVSSTDVAEVNIKFHPAFVAKERSHVDAFYAAGVKAGGKDNGKPGLRPHYGPNYYAAFVYDPVGNNIEVVAHGPE